MEREENRFYAWSLPGCPVRMHLRMGGIAEADMPAGGEGLLPGRVESRTTEIARLVPANGRRVAKLLNSPSSRWWDTTASAACNLLCSMKTTEPWFVHS
jgi:hypothetical protein